MHVSLDPGSGAGAQPSTRLLPATLNTYHLQCQTSAVVGEEGALFRRIETDQFGKESLLLGFSDPSGFPATDAKQTGPDFVSISETSLLLTCPCGGTRRGHGAVGVQGDSTWGC